jgi:hypothetical protein
MTPSIRMIYVFYDQNAKDERIIYIICLSVGVFHLRLHIEPVNCVRVRDGVWVREIHPSEHKYFTTCGCYTYSNS